jgi:hypothetical protein
MKNRSGSEFANRKYPSDGLPLGPRPRPRGALLPWALLCGGLLAACSDSDTGAGAEVPMQGDELHRLIDRRVGGIA